MFLRYFVYLNTFKIRNWCQFGRVNKTRLITVPSLQTGKVGHHKVNVRSFRTIQSDFFAFRKINILTHLS